MNFLEEVYQQFVGIDEPVRAALIAFRSVPMIRSGPPFARSPNRMRIVETNQPLAVRAVKREGIPQAVRPDSRGLQAGVLIGFEWEEDWFDYRLEHDPRFLRRIELARHSLRAGRGVRLEDVENE